jgi:general nucleoside transport system ATP-binding protein
MIGQDRIPEWQKNLQMSEKIILDIKNLSVRNDRGLADLDNFSLQLKEGEILGIAGLPATARKPWLKP